MSLCVLRKQALSGRLVIGRILMGVSQLSRRRETRRRPRRCDGTMNAIETINREYRQLQRCPPDAFVCTLYESSPKNIFRCIAESEQLKSASAKRISHALRHRRSYFSSSLLHKAKTFAMRRTTLLSRVSFFFPVKSRGKWKRLSQTFYVSRLIIRMDWSLPLRIHSSIFFRENKNKQEVHGIAFIGIVIFDKKIAILHVQFVAASCKFPRFSFYARVGSNRLSLSSCVKIISRSCTKSVS